ncbi:hypothetical protein LPR20_003698 [Vibrio mimicus]
MLFTPQRILSYSLILAIALVVIFEFLYVDSIELFKGGAKLADIVVNMSLSYMAAYLFYLVTYLAPKYQSRNVVEEHVAFLIGKILFELLFIVHDSSNMQIEHKRIKSKELTLDEVKSELSGVFMEQPLKYFRVGEDGHNQTVGEAVSRHLDSLRLHIDELLVHSQVVEPELIKQITDLLRLGMCESWINSYKSIGKKIFFGDKVLYTQPSSIESSSEDVYSFYLAYHKIEKILLENYKATNHVKKRTLKN